MDDGTFLAGLAAGAVVSLGAVSLAAGALAGLLSGGGLPRMTASVPQTLLLSVVKGPASVYQPAPPAWLFFAVFGLLVVLLTVLAGVVVRRLGRRRRRSLAGGATWGGAKTEKEMALPENPAERPDRITAGRGKQTRKVVGVIERSASAIAFGPPGSAKTSGLLAPNAAEWQGPALVTTTKAADLEEIYAARSHIGPVWVIAPAGIPAGPWRTAHWSPVDYAVDEEAAERMAEWMADASQKAYDPKAEPWMIQARAIVAGLLLAARISEGGIASFRRWLTQGEAAVDHVRALLDARYPEAALDYAQPWTNLHDDGKGSVQFTMNVLAATYRSEGIRSAASRTDFRAEELLARNGTLVLIAAPSQADRFAPYFTSLIASVLHAAEARYERVGRHPDRTLGLFVDEAGNFLRYPKLPNVLTTGRGMGIAVLSIWHDYSQLVARMGREGAKTIISASTLRLLLPGLADDETLRYMSFLFGKELVERTGHTSGSGRESTSTNVVESDLLPVHQLREIPEHTAIALYFNRPPIRVRMRLTWRDRDVKAWLARPAATSVPRPAPSLEKAREATDV
ncbi:type IV secretory system conjugative DNA transfer family protein [Kitasatospora sp. RG8]|uniref:type IV secretory system conjugative DNA transfer family protein n=1 Tax=Kitasatospora sp. RG8 TaxID=2820815 RepID=UPI001AE0614C|nr:type IV secretory system conjugative DNA transfer family protein [Kitasatospora sp. RG8]MBP0453943.1 type IV secretory system conjugative DNA transfer family protein [Kitasatospora sp. RG8]